MANTATDSVRAARSAPRITASTFVEALPPAARYVLRGGAEVMAAAGGALDLTISQQACRAATSPAAASGAPIAAAHQVAALWLGPDEQLLLGPAGLDLGAALQPVLGALPHSLVEVSHRQIALQVSGPHATALLTAGCPLDLDPSAFPVGMCTRTVLAKAEIVLWRTDRSVFHIEVWRSFASYVSSFLAEVARELVFEE